MSETFAAYVPAAAPGPQNLETGLSSETWGWRSELAGKHLGTVRNLASGDGIILASGAPSPRVPPGEWTEVAFKQFYLAGVTEGHHLGDSPLWSDEVESDSIIYPERIKFELIAEAPRAETTSPEIAEALRLSANTKGAPVRVGRPATDEVERTKDHGIEVFSGDLDALRLVKTRKEQSLLQKHLFAGLITGTCALCSKDLPVDLLHAAHIKRRSKCSFDERRNLDNVMAACTLGCDELFERGYIFVDQSGTMRAAPTESDELREILKGYAGLKIGIHSPSNASFFEWHRKDRTGSA